MARDFLIGAQRSDGSWVFADESSPSDVARAALCLSALKKIEVNGQASAAGYTGERFLEDSMRLLGNKICNRT